MIGERLQTVIDYNRMSKEGFAESVGLTPKGVSDILANRTKQISRPVLKAIEYRYGINPDWLILGIGEMRVWNDSSFNNQNSGGNSTITVNHNITISLKKDNEKNWKGKKDIILSVFGLSFITIGILIATNC